MKGSKRHPCGASSTAPHSLPSRMPQASLKALSPRHSGQTFWPALRSALGPPRPSRPDGSVPPGAGTAPVSVPALHHRSSHASACRRGPRSPLASPGGRGSKDRCSTNRQIHVDNVLAQTSLCDACACGARTLCGNVSRVTNDVEKFLNHCPFPPGIASLCYLLL